MAQFFFHHSRDMQKSCVCVCISKKKLEACLFFWLRINVQRRQALEWRACVCCLALLRVEPDERPSPAWKALCSGGRGDRGRERERRKKKSPSLALLEISTKERDGGRVKQADCLESNKTRRLRGPGSSFGSFDWFQRIGLGPTRRESLKLLIVGSPSLKISVYSKHISLRSWPWPELIFIKVGRVAALTKSVSGCLTGIGDGYNR